MTRLATALTLMLASGTPVLAMPSDLIRDEFLAQHIQNMGLDAKALGVLSLPPATDPIPGAAVTPDPSHFTTRGIDISHYQGDIKWDKVAKAGVSFVYMKATEGSDLPDDYFQANWKGASQAGLAKGAYHFYNLCGKGDPQADFFIKTVPVEAGALPPAIDLEATKSCRASLPTKEVLQKELGAFIAKVKKTYGKDPVLYINETLYTKYFAGDEIDSPFWICDLVAEPDLSDKRKWSFWQYSFKGKVSGIDGDVDLDVFSGTLQQLAELTLPGAAPTVAMLPGSFPRLSIGE